jgi:hypothetical protein
MVMVIAMFRVRFIVPPLAVNPLAVRKCNVHAGYFSDKNLANSDFHAVFCAELAKLSPAQDSTQKCHADPW